MTISQQLNEKQKKHLWPNHLLYYQDPLPLDRGEGVVVWDVDGNRYLDFFAGILTTSVGHNNQRVNERIHAQVDKMLHSSTLYPNAAHLEYAEMLGKITPDGLDTFYFGATGTDADESAVLLAQVHTGNTEIIALRHGYSGKSQMAMTLTGQSSWRMGPVHIGYVRHAMTPYVYRALGNLDETRYVQACLDDLQDVIQTMTSGRIAGMILEPIQGVGGFITLPDAYLRGAAEIVRAHGGLVIIDEVQTGFGRTGTHWWGHQHSGIKPDIMTMAKGIANGMPLSAVATTADIAQSLVGAGLTVSTFGGNPVCCAAAIGTLEEMMNQYNPDHCAAVGEELEAGLKHLQQKYPIIGEVRGRGLMQATEIVSDPVTKEAAPHLANAVLEAGRQAGILIGKGGMFGNVLRIAPPLSATKEDVAEALQKLDIAFARVQEMA
ncbi:MAG: aspartate aminotransferase family protein [Ardenticatenaceae bacterium]|nr:aspartate aminotransferase family protein [Ardenticatenaceae bacterium]